MKVLLFVPEQYYGFYQTTKDTFEHLDGSVNSIDFHPAVNNWEKRFNDHMFRFPASFRNKWEAYYLNKINQYYIQEYDRIKPDIIFIYNNQLLLPATVQYFKKRSKIAFFLGDHPYYTNTNRHFLPLLFHADAIYTTDSFWIAALKKLGLKNLNFMYPSLPPQHFKKELAPDVYEEFQSEVLFVGMNYKTSWGFKKAKFLSVFTDFDLVIHGDDSWKRWFSYFPELEKHYKPRTGYITVERMNDMYNATKIAPIDANAGLLHAVHWRMLEALGSGALPLMEWQNGVDEIFGKDADVPAVKCFDDAKEITQFYLNNEDKRLEKVAWMTNLIKEKYSIENNAALLSQTLKLS